MKNDKYPVLVVDDEEPIRRLLKKELDSPEREIFTAASAQHAREMLRQRLYDVVVLDLRLPDTENLDFLIEVRESLPNTEVVMITGQGDIDSAVEAMKLGACDFIPKPFNLDRIDLVVEKAHQRVRLARENQILKHSSGKESSPTKLVGKSKAIKNIQFLIDKVAPTNVPVLITGESGAGKDVVAHAIHDRSTRSGNPIIIKNCASLQKELARSELFGHVKGSFTGATESQEGLMAYAHESTLFLDEIGELPLEVQASLLRVLETQTYRRVGEKDERRVDIRFLFATNRNLAEEVEAGRFHEALYHRINVFNISIPDLSERKEDLPLLVDYFLATLSPEGQPHRIVDSAMKCIMRYDWPGNIRELRNVIERSMILAENGIITANALPRELVMASENSEDDISLDSIEKKHILRMLDFFEGNRRKTAEALGISRKTLYRKINRYGLES
ncbi:sigma-54-dependent transcriptional regulator [Maridesulfovibrio bastinii]|jgi:two-component system NtrC family response regulator|uniref:sigma-54-dependent transcriptional regulator n=1 Tax=Maridesulfovibrio bastinii TaxID=47157 RepID=UPI0003F70AD3|nr:sigma-54 dependent transcriptional regulator [Maridesulfovibrio bastinii]